VRILYIPLVLALLTSCGGGGDLPQTLDGTWAATSQPVGSETKFTLKEQNSQIVGAGTYREVAGATGVLAVAGGHSGVAVTLELAYDSGAKATYAALLTDSTHMSGAFTVQGGSTSTLEFARQ
jgi:hypothetical protein